MKFDSHKMAVKMNSKCPIKGEIKRILKDQKWDTMTKNFIL